MCFRMYEEGVTLQAKIVKKCHILSFPFIALFFPIIGLVRLFAFVEELYGRFVAIFTKTDSFVHTAFSGHLFRAVWTLNQ